MPRLLSPEGRAEDVPDASVEAAMRAGYKPETGLDVLAASDSRIVADRQAARGPLDQVGAAALGVARGATFGASDVLVGDSELTDNLKTDFATTSALSEVAGAIAPALLTGGGSAAASVARLLPAGRAAMLSGRIAQGGGVARAAAAGAFEGAAQTAGHYLSDAALHDRDLSAEAFMAEAGKGALLGGAVGGGLSAAERGFVAARSMFPKSSGTKAAVRRAADDVDRELTKALVTGDDNLGRARSQLDLMAAADPDLAAAAQARVAEKQAAMADLKLAEQQARTDLAAYRLDRAKNPPPRSSRARAKKGDPVASEPSPLPAGFDPPRGVFDEIEAIPAGSTFPGRRFDEPAMGAADVGTVVGKTPRPDAKVLPFPSARLSAVARPAADAGDDLLAQLAGTAKRLDDGESIVALNAERRGQPTYDSLGPDDEIEALIPASALTDRIQLDAGFNVDPVRVAKAERYVAEGLRPDGNGDPIRLALHPDGRYEVIGGRHRIDASVRAGMPVPARVVRASQQSAVTPLHAAMAEIDPKAGQLVEAVKQQERAAEAIRRRFTIRDKDGTHRVAIAELEGMTVGRIKQAYQDATDAEKSAILETIGPKKAKALTEIVEGRAKFDKWYKNREHVYEDGSYNPAEAFPLTRDNLEMRMPPGVPDVRDAPPLDFDEIPGIADHVDAITANKAASELADYERSHVALTDALGPAAVPQAVELRAGVAKALSEQKRKAVTRMAQSADDDASRAAMTVSLPGAPTSTPAKRGGLLGLASDFVAANEGLQALGVATPFDVDKIPLVGPLLGVWGKYRAAAGVAGKFGLKIPFSGEARVAGAGAASRDRMASAVDALLVRGAKVAAKSRPIAPAVAWRAADVIGERLFGDGKRHKAETMADAMRARSEELQAAAANPAAVRALVRESMRDVRDPDLVDAAVAVALRKVEYLAKHAPQPPIPDLLSRSTWRPSPTEIERFARRVRAANNPITVLEDVATGRITAEGAETLREVYPRLYGAARDQLIERSAELQEELPHALVVRLAVLFDAPLVRSLEPAHMAAIQAIGVPQQQSQPAPPMGAMQAPPAGAPNVSDLYMTADQRRAR